MSNPNEQGLEALRILKEISLGVWFLALVVLIRGCDVSSSVEEVKDEIARPEHSAFVPDLHWNTRPDRPIS